MLNLILVYFGGARQFYNVFANSTVNLIIGLHNRMDPANKNMLKKNNVLLSFPLSKKTLYLHVL